MIQLMCVSSVTRASAIVEVNIGKFSGIGKCFYENFTCCSFRGSHKGGAREDRGESQIMLQDITVTNRVGC